MCTFYVCDHVQEKHELGLKNYNFIRSLFLHMYGKKIVRGYYKFVCF